jgi:hypothetical protein
MNANQPLKRIYLDNNIWDQLFDQHVDPKDFLDSLAGKGYTLVISFHAVYEFARAFTSSDPAVLERGRQLCAYVKQYLDLGMPCTKEFWEQIVAEAYAFENDLPQIDQMATLDECALTAQELGKLARGIIEERVKKFLDRRLEFAKNTRTDQKSHMAVRTQLKQNLKDIKQADLIKWMQQETFAAEGVRTLYEKFIKRLGPGPTPQYILNLLRFPLAEASRASVRGDLYYNWHSAKHGGIRLDLLDDILHMLQAVYCDLYLSEDKSQAQYGPLILTSKTRIEIYGDRKTSVDQWILGLL